MQTDPKRQTADDGIIPTPASGAQSLPVDRVTRRTMLIRTAGAAAGIAAMHCLKSVSALAVTDPNAEVWDVHVHLTGTTGTPEERIDQLLKFADRMGVDRLVLSLGYSFTNNPTPTQLRKANDEVLAAMAHAPPKRILGFVYVNPRRPEASIAEINRCVRDGPMVGVKIWVAIKCNAPELDPIVRRAVELKAPILQHCFWKNFDINPDESNPADLVELAARHPDASFICAHSGGDWERGIRILRTTKNICAEFSGSDPTAGFIEMAVRELGPERIVYGSDVGGRSFASQLAKVYSADVPEATRRLILGGNLRRLLKPILQQKGMKL
jgi:predicted TIM-barrel fold metal-dependent hydrolase